MFATDTVLTTLMCAARSVYSWDVVVTRAGDKLFFDSRFVHHLQFVGLRHMAMLSSNAHTLSGR